MSQLETWACDWLYSALTISPKMLASDQLDKNTLLQLRSYSRSKFAESIVFHAMTFIQYFISISAREAPYQDQTSAFNLNTCVELYKDPMLPKDDPVLFGCVFAAILSLGHRSSTWTTQLSGRDRSILYAAQTQLVTVCDQLTSLGWLLRPWETLPSFNQVCFLCRPKCSVNWNETFGQCGNLNSNIPLQDISSLARLPQYRLLLLEKWEGGPTSTSTIISEALASAWSSMLPYTLSCLESDCWGCILVPITSEVDARIQKVYEELTDRYNRFAS